jgi:hypothetical protein
VNTGFWRGNLREKDCLTNLVVDGRIILKCILKKLLKGPGLIWLGTGTTDWSFEGANELSISIKCGEFFN